MILIIIIIIIIIIQDQKFSTIYSLYFNSHSREKRHPSNKIPQANAVIHAMPSNQTHRMCVSHGQKLQFRYLLQIVFRAGGGERNIK
jgi:hypothetical protein